jgi:hypothetical protein
VGTGSLSMTVASGAITMESSGLMTMHSLSTVAINAPLITLGTNPAPTFGVVAGAPTLPGGPAFDSLTGLPLMGQAKVLVG